MLFLGAGVFLGKVDKIVLAFMDSLSPSDVKCVVLFGSSAIVDSPVPQMRKRLEQRGITVSEGLCFGLHCPLNEVGISPE